MKALVISLLVLTVFGSMPDLAVLRANHASRMAETSQKLQSMHGEVKATLASLKSFTLQQTDTTTDEYYCNTAKLFFWAVWTDSQSNCSVVSEIWENVTDTRIGEIVQDYCVDKDDKGFTCFAKVNYAFEQYWANCSKTPQLVEKAALEQQRTLLTFSSITCLKDDTDQHSCLIDFRALRDLDSSWTEEKLKTVCSPCVRKVMSAFEIFAPKQFLQLSAYLNLICYQLNGEYCSVKFLNAIAASDGAEDGKGPTDEQLKLWCHPCTSAFVSKHLTIVTTFGGDLATIWAEVKFLKLIRVMCITNWQGEYCFTKLTNAEANKTFTTLGMACLPDLAGNTCSSNCHTEIQNSKNHFGCCFGTWFNLLEWQYAADRQNYDLPPPETIKGFIVNNCQSTVPIGCAKEKVIVSIVIRNIAWEWYKANKAQSEKDLHAYLMWLLNLDEESVSNVTVKQVVDGNVVGSQSTKSSVHLLAAGATGIEITSTVYPNTQTEVATVTAAVKGASDSSIPMANAWELSARSNPQQGISAASASAEPAPKDNASTSTTPAYYLATFIVAIVALLLL